MHRILITVAAFMLPLTICTAALAGPDADRCIPAPASAGTESTATDTHATYPAVGAADPGATVKQTTYLPAPAVHPKVVFQINQAADALAILRFVTNYLVAEPAAKVVVVGYAGGVDFMLKGAMDAAGKPYADQLQKLAGQGVVFKACNNTLKARNLTADAVAPAATVVPGAVNEIIRLQTREGYAYFRH